MKKLLFLLFLFVTTNSFALVSTLQQGTDSYTGCKEVEVYENQATTNQDADLTFEINRYTNLEGRNTLIKFDLTESASGIPANATISGVTISAYMTTTGGSATKYARRVLRDWPEDQATWTIYSTGNNWATAGGRNDLDTSSTQSASAVTAGTNAWVAFTNAQLVTDVQNFVDGTWDNYGWWFSAETTATTYAVFNGVRFGTASLRPKIAITYTVPEAVASGDPLFIEGDFVAGDLFVN